MTHPKSGGVIMCHVTPELITYWSIFCVTLPPDDQLNKYLTNNYIELCHSFLELDQVKGYNITITRKALNFSKKIEINILDSGYKLKKKKLKKE